MKPYLPIILAVAIVTAALGLTLVAARQMQSPQARLNARVDADVAKAASLLGGYDPLATTMIAAARPTETQPASIDDENFRTRANAIDEALNVIRNAVTTSEEDGDTRISGDKNAAATQLEAVLYLNKADLLRREAAIHRNRAEAAADRVADLAVQWRAVNTQMRSLERDLTGAVPAAATQPAAEETAPAPSAPEAKPKAAAQPRGPRKPGALGRAIGKLFGGGAAPAPAPAPAPEPAAQPVADEPSATEPANPPRAAGPAPIVFEKLPTIAERIAELKTRRDQLATEVRNSEPEVRKLQESINDLQARADAARERASKAQREMLALEQKGVDPADPNGVKQFTQAYEAASKIQREADQEATILQNGAIENARPDTDDEEQVLKAPLTAIQPARPMQPQRGLVALKADLADAAAKLEGRKALVKQIDQQIAVLGKYEQKVSEGVETLKKSLADLGKRAAEAGITAIAESIAADKLEKEALSITVKDGPGEQAAKRASNAARDTVTGIRDFYSKNAPQETSPKANFLSGHAKVLEADMDYETAVIDAQRMRGIERQAAVLANLEMMGVDPATLLPKDAEKPSEWTYQAKSALADAGQARKDGEAAARSALDAFAGADAELSQMWMLHTNIGAVHYLLAQMVTDPAQAQKERDEARSQYERALRDKRDRPEALPYQGIVESLARSGR